LSDILTKLIRDAAFHNLGIAPIDVSISRYDFNKLLESLPPEESRKMKRKFRKLWRKYSKELPRRYQEQMGLSHGAPTRSQKNLRKSEVLRRVNLDVVRPAVNKLTSTEE